jgi:xanthine dehydrogenase YagS FAD-binding subunit
VKPITLLEPRTLQDAVAALNDGATTRPIAGGSDLLGELKEGIAPYDTLVSLAGIEGLRGLERTDAGLRIGALTTISELEYSPELAGPYRMLAEAARSVATPEVRNQGTLGGNLCQRPRCLHYRIALAPCLKKGGDGCPAAESPYQAYLSVMGGAGCYAVHPSDLAPPLIALGAIAQIEGAGGPREVPLEQFFTGPELDVTLETCLEPGELLTGVVVPEASAAWRGIYTKGRERTAGDFAVVSVAAGFELRDGVMRDCRVVLGSVAPTPVRSGAAETLLEGQEPSQDVAKTGAEAAFAGAQPLSHNAYKAELARVLLERAILRVAAS